jgi:hypothetical protein
VETKEKMDKIAQKFESDGRELGIAHCNFWNRLSGRGIMKCHLCREENYRSTIRLFVEGRCRNKATEIGNSSLQGWVVEYGRKSKGDGEDNVRIK